MAIAAVATGLAQRGFFAANRYHFPAAWHWRRRAAPGVLHYSLAGEASARQWLSAWCARRGWQLQVADGGAVWNLLAWHQGKADARLVERCARAGGGLRMDKRCLCRRRASDAVQRHALLSGRPGAAVSPRGRIVCSCFGVGNGQLTRPSPAAAPASGRWVGS
ncbi:hypothetical protein LNO23_18640 [Klebsiella pneumoniae subsp. pneumoniae]|nr:hypothetical protein [Klebsiella pneumoniae subsp. pneumoniae]